uniref:NADPH--hemoprotein reductase n=1 Tax=Anopheles coluzzii TaxID=1518534 RepID=A0A8W7PZM8_ANOCL
MDAQTETEVPAGSVSDEPFLGPLDIVLLVSLLAGTAWYLLKGKKKESQASQFKSYSIQKYLQVFGLGNKTYEHYNKVGIYVDKRLEELGANRVFELGLGDDDANIEDYFITWKEKFWPTVCDYFGIESTGEDVLMRQYRLLEQPDVSADRIYTGEVARLHSLQTQRPPFDAKNPFLAPIKVNRELHKAGGRSCMHVEFDIEGSKMRYEAGDHLAMYPEWVQDSCRNIVHVLEDIPSCHPPIDHVCELLPRLQPRYYSISSSSKLHPTTVHVTAVLVKYETKTGRLNKGVATTFLAEKHPNDGEPAPRVPIFIRKSQFRLPPKPETPVIMVGPGTGLAPFRGFIQERDHCKQEGKEIGQTTLYFGCRKRSEDYIYEDELEDYSKRGIINLRVAFSRDQEKKVYVTHLLEQDSDLIWSVIGENKGHFYICGDAKNMATDVRNILLKVIRTKGGLSETEAQQYIKKMEAQKRYSADVWS